MMELRIRKYSIKVKNYFILIMLSSCFGTYLFSTPYLSLFYFKRSIDNEDYNKLSRYINYEFISVFE